MFAAEEEQRCEEEDGYEDEGAEGDADFGAG